jgi:hypothetical protein
MEAVQHLPEEHSHRDWMLNNMILQGKKMVLIDQNDQKNMSHGCGFHIYTPKLREKMEEFILMEDAQKIKTEFFRFVSQ